MQEKIENSSVNAINSSKQEEIKNGSVYGLPNEVNGDPTRVKDAMYSPIEKLITEINRIVGETNESIKGKVSLKNIVSNIVKDELEKEKIPTVQAVRDYILTTHPVTSVIVTMREINPSTFIGGTWKNIGKGRTLVGVDESDDDFKIPRKEAGEKKHILTESEMPSHSHKIRTRQGTGAGNWATVGSDWTDNTYFGGIVESTGGGQSHNNLQPYLTCYFWERIA